MPIQIETVPRVTIYIDPVRKFDCLEGVLSAEDFMQFKADYETIRAWGDYHGLPVYVKESISLLFAMLDREDPEMAADIAHSLMEVLPFLSLLSCEDFDRFLPPLMLDAEKKKSLPFALEMAKHFPKDEMEKSFPVLHEAGPNGVIWMYYSSESQENICETEIAIDEDENRFPEFWATGWTDPDKPKGFKNRYNTCALNTLVQMILGSRSETLRSSPDLVSRLSPALDTYRQSPDSTVPESELLKLKWRLMDEHGDESPIIYEGGWTTKLAKTFFESKELTWNSCPEKKPLTEEPTLLIDPPGVPSKVVFNTPRSVLAGRINSFSSYYYPDHFVAIVSPTGGRWYECDDEYVTPISPELWLKHLEVSNICLLSESN